MIKRFGGLYLREESDTLVITSYYSLLDFDKKLELDSDNILYTDKKKSEIIAIDRNCKVLITVDQGGRKSPNTSSEIYIQKEDQLTMLCIFRSYEEINDLRKTQCYKLVEYIAERLQLKYGIEWEYKIGVDTPEKQMRFDRAVLMMVLMFVTIAIIGYCQLKYGMHHPR